MWYNISRAVKAWTV